jgi:hypothetical protein
MITFLFIFSFPPSFNYFSWFINFLDNQLEGLRKTTDISVRIVDNATEIRTGTSQLYCYTHTNLLGVIGVDDTGTIILYTV